MKISIVTAVWNRENSIADCLQSVHEQTYPHIEHVIIDGGSTDATLSIIQNTPHRDGPMVSEPDHGIYDAINKGIQLATGDYVGLMHADDLFDGPHVVAQLVEQLQNTPADAIYGDLEYVSSTDTRKVIRYWKSGHYTHGLMKRGWMPPHPTVFIRRDLFPTYGYYRTDMRIAADYERMLHLFHFEQKSLIYYPHVVTRMRVGGASNKSLKNIIQKSQEDLKAWALRGHTIQGLMAVFLKNFSKLAQFWKRKSANA